MMFDSKYILKNVVSLENLHWAWEKAKNFYDKDEYWIDHLELARFTANYENELKLIIDEINEGKYQLTPLRPIFYPKCNDTEGNSRNRQMFWVAVRDQLVWLAVANVIGSIYDSQMPFWSYGNRLYISIFPKGIEKNKIKWGYGPYRNSTTNTYRSFQQSWPRFRRDIYLTAKIISNRQEDLTETEMDDINQNEILSDLLRVYYKISTYWGSKHIDKLYYCSVDLTKFYPSLKNNFIMENIKEFSTALKENFVDYEKLLSLIDKLLDWKISYKGLDGVSLKDYELIQLNNQPIRFAGIPTGLFIAGFLSNLALLKVDLIVNQEIENRKKSKNRIAHFRFVDDHFFLSTSPDAIFEWIEYYNSVLKNQLKDIEGNPSVLINADKTKPEALKEYLKRTKEDSENVENKVDLKHLNKCAIEQMVLDPKFPTPLMNLTIEKISMIHRTPFEILDNSECLNLLHDIEHLLVTDFPDEEIRQDTRMAFAIAKLTNFVPKLHNDYSDLYEKKKTINNRNVELIEKKKLNNSNNPGTGNLNFEQEIQALEQEIATLNNELEDIKINHDKKVLNRNIHLFQLFLKSAKDHPDKIKLWKRSIEFWSKNGITELTISDDYNNQRIFEDLISLVNELFQQKKINNLSRSYLETYIVQLITHLFIDAYKRLKIKNRTYKDKNRLLSLLFYIAKSNILDVIFQEKHNSATYYQDQTLIIFKAVLGTFIYSLKDFKEKSLRNLYSLYTGFIEKHGLLDWNNPNTFSEENKKNLDLLTWFLTSWFDFPPGTLIPRFLEKYIETAKFSSIYFSSIVLLYPKLVNPHLAIKLAQQKNKVSLPFGWWLDFFENNPESINDIENINQINIDAKKCLYYLKKIRDKQLSPLLYIIKDAEKAIELTEIYSLEIAKQIIELYIKNNEEVLDFNQIQKKVRV